MTKPTFLIFTLILYFLQVKSQPPGVNRESLNRLTQADYKMMLDKLGIDPVRRGPSGNPNAQDAANTDEAKVLPYFLPDPLVFNDGTRARTPEQWEKRRNFDSGRTAR